MRHLVLCGRCGRQLDAGELAAGARLRCSCGEQIEVPPLEAHDSAVVRCSACGAPRQGDEAECRYCGSSFTVHERDIDTICPGCMARVSGSARFCSHCGSPILVAQAAAGAAQLNCPACGAASRLASRRLGAEPVAVSECSRCGGIWVDRAAFEVLVVRARHAQLGAPALATVAAADDPAGRSAAATAGGPAALAAGEPSGQTAPLPGGRLYRPCAVCGALMNRQNYGRKSGVILDLCRAHGIWFDLDELPRVLGWIQDGGEQRAGQLDTEEAHAAARARRLEEDAGRAQAEWVGYSGQPDRDLLGGLTDLLDEGIRRLFHRF